jgi:hypothetical protein
MSFDKISRYHASVDGETVFLRDVPKGGLTNVTFLHSALQRRIDELKREFGMHPDFVLKQRARGAVAELEDIIRALGEEPL